MNKYRFLNPYNFVRYLPEGKEDRRPEIKLLGRCAPPTHDRFIGITGRMECELEAVTPIFISDSEFVENKGNEHMSYGFFRLRNENGQEEFAIPSTSLRGMLRSVFEAATNSCFSVFKIKNRLYYHLQASDARKLIPGRIEKDDNGNWRLRLLPGETPYNQNGPIRSDCLYAAWIKMYSLLRSSNTERQNLKSPYTKRNLIKLPRGIEHGSECFALLEKIEHPPRQNSAGRSFGGFRFWNVKAIAEKKEKLSQSPKSNERIKKGFVCVTFQNIKNKHDERFFFRGSKNNFLPETIEINGEIIQKYRDLINDYKERHKKDIERIRERGGDPSTVNNNAIAYSRFIIEDKEDLNGELVYAMLDGDSQNLSVKFIVPVSVPRVGYENTIGNLPPQPSYPCLDYNNLCPACRLFGWVHPEPLEDLAVKVSYAGRIKISHAQIVENKGTLNEFPLAILSTPKPTATFFYLLKNGKPDFSVTYDTPDAHLRGRKFYRHQNEAKEQEYVRAEKKEDHQNRTIRDALKPGAKFKFTIEFENLAPVEFGSLLWSIKMENGMFHKLGLGKSLGFGSVKVSVKDVKILEVKERYSSYAKDGWVTINNDKKREWVNLFKKSMTDKYKKDFYELENIKDLKAISSSPSLPVHYPRTSEEPDIEGRNFEWFMQNKKFGKKPLELATKDTVGFPLEFDRANRRRRY